MNGERAKECSDCWIREDSNVRSEKCDAGTSIKSKKRRDQLYDAVDRTNADGSIDDYKVSYLEFRDNNICNTNADFVTPAVIVAKEWTGMERMMMPQYKPKTGVSWLVWTGQTRL